MHTMAMSLCTLKPITPISTSRYLKSPSVYSYHTTIPTGPHHPHHNPSTWISYSHPEGQLYFQTQFPNYGIVTEENLHSPQTQTRVDACVKFIDDVISQQQFAVPPSSELFIELDESSSCAYYFVNHDTRRIFWLEQTSTEILDMGTVVSISHIGTALERMYWVHVEFFPMHICAQIPPQVVDDLIGVMSHGAADRLTSRSSTFPYTAEKCSQLLQLLSLRREGQTLDGHTLCYVARLWGAIENQRFMTYYGQEYAQLDRLQIMTPEEDNEHEWIKTLAHPALWGIPGHYLSELHDLFANEQVFVDQWQTFMGASISEWHTAVVWTFPVIIANILSCLLSRASLSSALPSILSASGSLVTGSILLLRHHGLEDATASYAARYLRGAKKSHSGMLPSAIVFSLPKGLHLWSVVFMVAHLLMLASHMVGKLAMFGGGCLLILLVWAVVHVTSPDDEYEYQSYDRRSILSKILCRWHSLQGSTSEPILSA